MPLQGLAQGEKVLAYAGALANATCRCYSFQVNDALFPQVSSRMFKVYWQNLVVGSGLFPQFLKPPQWIHSEATGRA